MKHPRTLHESWPGLRSMLRFFWPRIRKQHRLLTASVLALMAEVILGTLEPWPLKFIFDHVLEARRAGRSSVFSPFESLPTSTIITVSALAIILISGLRALADYWSAIGFARLANRVLTELRGALSPPSRFVPFVPHQGAKWRPAAADHERCQPASRRRRDGLSSFGGRSSRVVRSGRCHALA